MERPDRPIKQLDSTGRLYAHLIHRERRRQCTVSRRGIQLVGELFEEQTCRSPVERPVWSDEVGKRPTGRRDERVPLPPVGRAAGQPAQSRGTRQVAAWRRQRRIAQGPQANPDRPAQARVLSQHDAALGGVEDGGVPVTPRTLFRIGSTTKPLTGTAVMRLVEAGALDLDRPIRDDLDWFALSGDRPDPDGLRNAGDGRLRRDAPHP